MLQSIRDHLTGWVAGALFGLIALSFAVWGIQYDFTQRSFAAKVNGEEIPVEQVRAAYQNQLAQFQQYYGGDISPEIQTEIRDNLLEAYIRQTLLEQRTDSEGYRIGDELVVQSIHSNPRFQVGGEFSEDSYRAYLSIAGRSPAGYEAEQRTMLRVTQLQNAIQQTSFTTPSELRTYVELENEQRALAYARILVSDYADEDAVTEAAIGEYYEAYGEEFQTPETVVVEYVSIKVSDLADEVTVEEEELRERYDAVKERFSVDEERRARHILIAVAEDADESALLAASVKAVGLKKRIDEGEDLTQLAEEFSDDPGSAAQGGDLGWAAKGVYVGAFEDALFDMEIGEIRGPIKSRFGYHIIRLEEIRPGTTKEFAEVRDELLTELREEKAQDQFTERADELADEAFAAFTELESVADRLGLTLQRIDEFKRTGGGEFETNAIVIDTVFSDELLSEGQNSPLIAVSEDQAAVFRVADHQLPEQRPLEDVREEIRAQLIQEAAEVAAENAGRQVVDRLESGAALEEIARELSAEFEAERYVSRAEAGVPGPLLTEIFRAPVPADDSPTVGGLRLLGGDYAVYVLSDVRAGDPGAVADAERIERERQLAAQQGTGDLVAYVEEARQQADVVKGAAGFEDVQ